MIKIKYTAGKNKDTVAELDDIKAKSLVDDGLAEQVEDTDPMGKALDGYETKAREINEKLLTELTAKGIDNFSKGIQRTSIKVGLDRAVEDETGGFKSLAHFMLEVMKSGQGMINPSPAIVKHHTNLSIKTAGASPFNSEGSPLSLTPGITDGAIIPVAYSTVLYQTYGEDDDLMALCFPFAMNSLSAKLPLLVNYNFSNTNPTVGITVSEPGEGNLIPLSKTTWEQRLFTLVKEGIIVPISNEALDDNNVGLAQATAAQGIWQIKKTINGGILRGTSVTSSQAGILGNAATKIAARAVNGTVSYTDLLTMYAAFAHGAAGGNYSDAVWIVHPTVLPKLGTSTVGNYPAFVAPGGGQTSQGQPLSILGPIIVSGWAEPLGTTGDVFLIDFKSSYVMGYKGGVQTFVSPHIYMVSDQTAIRMVQRVNGQHARTSLTTLQDGITTVSPSVVLGTTSGLS
jgi:HK97 family phage major capsid protein